MQMQPRVPANTAQVIPNCRSIPRRKEMRLQNIPRGDRGRSQSSSTAESYHTSRAEEPSSGGEDK